MIDVVGLYPPAIFLDVRTNRRYVLTGGPWVEISHDIQMCDINWINLMQKHYRQKDEVFVIEGSKGDKYNVTKFANGEKSCDCMGYSFRRSCKHLVMVK